MGQKRGRKRIALLLGQPEEYRQSQFISGFVKESLELDIDVCIFSMYIKYQNSPEREIGESSVFSLVSYDEFDAIAVFGDTIQTPGVITRIEEDLRANFKGEVLFVEYESRYFRSVRMDNYHPIKKVIDHLIEDHGYKDIYFLTGKAWHPHSVARQKAFIDSMNEHGLNVDDSMLFQGDYWYTSGESLGERLVSSGAPLPDAIACANDCMAIGIAKSLTSHGIKIPDDIAIVGFDTCDEGQHAPIPLTSAPIPATEFGVYSAKVINDILEGRDYPEFSCDTELFIGYSCGCKGDSIVPQYPIRKDWDTETSMSSVNTLFNNMNEDLIGQSTFNSLVSTIFSYIFQIGKFKSFDICLNEEWTSRDNVKDISGAYSDTMHHIISCRDGEKKSDRIGYDSYFPTSKMIPLLDEERSEPAAFFFLPLHFNDHVFGYSVISFPNDGLQEISPDYRAWLRSVMRGLEFFRQNDSLIRSSQILKSGILRDNITGLYNYQGFLNMGETLMGHIKNSGGYMGAMAVDVRGLSAVNEQFGRTMGDRVILEVSNFLEQVFNSNYCFCFSIGNGEMVALRATSNPDVEELIASKNEFMKMIDDYNGSGILPCEISVYAGTEVAAPECIEDIERLVNTAIGKKNGAKARVRHIEQNNNLTENEQIEANIVQAIIDDNKISYHFQPIVSAKTGDIFGYEALMRADTTPYMAPPVIIKYAEFFNRLHDVEYMTFFNVLKTVMANKSAFSDGRKIFINSIPDHQLTDEDMAKLGMYFDMFHGSIVVELSEKAEMGDDELNRLKKKYAAKGIETAIDDYGSGYSNVNNLLRYMPQYVKIDRLLLSDITNSPQKQHFVKDIIHFSHDNGIIALAEGVETSDELRTVIELGADLIQGYYTARPSREPIFRINEKVIREIREYSGFINESDDSKGTYRAGREGRINLINLQKDGIHHICIDEKEPLYRDLLISGIPGEAFDMDITIGNGYQGLIIFENVELDAKGSNYSVTVKGKSNVTVILKGENDFSGGVGVEKGSVADLRGINTEDIRIEEILSE
ncbi:MAG: EAL domain-containing protein [Clostridiales bacterium]|nr:EAL domain-containing protein [Clostridiales bacterium]